MAVELNGPRNIYEELWTDAVAAFARNAPRIDPHLRNRAADPRRGVALAARPDAQVCERVQKFLRKITAIAPGQHFYRPEEFHVTVYSIIPGSPAWKESAQRLPEYLAVLDGVLENRPAFSIAFRGVTASPEAVMIQGFPVGDALNELRDELARRDVGANLKRRYKIAAAHLTMMRFSTPMQDCRPLLEILAANRDTDFGETRVRSLQLVEGDWYASADTVRVLREYPLV